MNDEQEISDWFQEGEDPEIEESSFQQVLDKTRSATGKKDAMDLVFVKIWAAMLVLLAPLFASAARRQSEIKPSKPVAQKIRDTEKTSEESITKNTNGDAPAC